MTVRMYTGVTACSHEASNSHFN